jgi:rod shape-determining protein MreB
VISLGGIVVDNTLRLAGDQMDQDIVNYVKQKYNLLIGERTAEDIKIAIGSAHESIKVDPQELSGRDLVSGLPKTIKLTGAEVREALSGTINKITEATKDALEETPPELLVDLIDHGITMAGGGSLLRGFDKHLSEKLNIPVHLAERPISCVAEGCGIALNEMDLLNQIQITSDDII